MARRIMRKLEDSLNFKLQVGDTVDSEIILAFTGQDPEDVSDNVDLLQSETGCASDILGKRRLFETFCRPGKGSAWTYVGLCEKGSCINRHPGEGRKVFICSRYADNPVLNIRFAKAACYEAFTNGCFPVAPHLYFTRFLHEGGDGYEREWGIAAGHELMGLCDEIMVYVIDGEISVGMQLDIDYAVNQLAMEPVYVTMTAKEADEYMRMYLDDADALQGLNPAEE